MKELTLISTEELSAELSKRFTSCIIVGCQDDGEKGQNIFQDGSGSIFAQFGIAKYAYELLKLDHKALYCDEIIIEDD